MPRDLHQIVESDLIDMNEYQSQRQERRTAMSNLKKNRRMAVGPDATFYFECYDTMWHQIHEMLFIEKGGAPQVADELEAYNPLIPNGRELVATVMFEIDEPERREKVLSTLGGVEETMSIRINGDTVAGVAEADVDRTSAKGKASSVQFVHFPFSEEQVAAFRHPQSEVMISIGHENYAHMAVVPKNVRDALGSDFD